MKAVPLILILCLARIASAENPYKFEAFGSLGAAHYLYGYPRGTSFNYGGGFGFRPFDVTKPRVLRMLGAEFEANGTRFSGNAGTATQSYFTANILIHGSLDDLEPYFLLGGGVSHLGETHRAGNVGIGVKGFITPRLSLRPEFRAFFTEYTGNFARTSIAIGYHW